MSSKTEDFPTPVSPTRRIVYGAFILFFDILITPFLRDSTSLEKMIRTYCIVNAVVTYFIDWVLSSLSSSKTFSGGLAGL